MTLKEYLDPNANEMTLPEFEQKLRASKAKILKRRHEAREIRIRKFGSAAAKTAFRKVSMSVVYCFYILLFTRMIDHQLQSAEAAEQNQLIKTSLEEHLTFTPSRRYAHIVERYRRDRRAALVSRFTQKFKALDADKSGLLEAAELTQAAMTAQSLDATQQAKVLGHLQGAQAANKTASLSSEAFLALLVTDDGLTLEDLVQSQHLPKLRFNDISAVTDIQDYLKGPLFQFLYGSDDGSSKDKDGRRDYPGFEHFPGNTIVAGTRSGSKSGGGTGLKGDKEKARVMIQLFAEQTNGKPQTNGVFPTTTSIWSTSSQELEALARYKNALGVETVVLPARTDSFTDEKTGLAFEYFSNPERSAFLTDNGQSGYIFSVPQDKSKARELIDKLSSFEFEKAKTRLAQLTIDFVIYNAHFDLYQTVRIVFWVDGAGHVRRQLDATKAEVNHFDTKTQNGQAQRKSSALWCEALFLLATLLDTIYFC